MKKKSVIDRALKILLKQAQKLKQQPELFRPRPANLKGGGIPCLETLFISYLLEH